MSAMAELIAAIPRCQSCGRRRMCPCLLVELGRVEEFHAWWKEETRPDERFLLGEFGEDGGVRVELVLQPKSAVDRYVERREMEEEMRAQAPPVTLPKLKRVTAKREVAAEAGDAVALKGGVESVNEFRLTSPSEKDLKKMKRRK